MEDYTNTAEAIKFEAWMVKIHNIYRTDNERMETAYAKILPLKHKH